MKKLIEHHWYGGRRFDIWLVDEGTTGEAYVFSIDFATMLVSTLQECKAVWIRESAKALREEAFRRRKARRAK
jgi:hypothetical protein